MIGGEADLRRAEQMASQHNTGQGGHFHGQSEDNSGGNADYPAQLSIDYQESSNRLSFFLRIILVIPILVVIGTVSGASAWVTGNAEADKYVVGFAPFMVGGWLFLGPLLMILFRKKYPKWWFDWNLALARFNARVAAFFLLLRDEYPSTDEEQAVHLNIEYPNAKTDLNRFLPIVKWILAIPHYIVLSVLGILAMVVTVLAWLLILILGRYPQGMFDFVVGVNRYGLRVGAYMWLLTTDRYPPFRLSE